MNTSLGVAAPFSLTPSSIPLLAPGASSNTRVTFTPAAAGAASGTVSVVSNDPARPSFTIPVTGNGGSPVIGGSCPSTTNISVGRTATSSSEDFNGPARLGNNGLIDEPNGYGFHTSREANPWWQVDLGAVQTICEVRMYNRSDCCSERARSIRVLLSTNGTNFDVAYSHNGTGWGGGGTPPLSVINEVRNRQARYVRVQLNETEYFHLREVEVYGGPAGTGGGGGATAPTISVTPTSIDFGSVTTGTSPTRTVTITNTGTAALSVSSLSTSAPFSITPTSIASIAPGASTTATVTFAPATAGAVSRSLTIASNDSARPSVTVALSGTGASGGGALGGNCPSTSNIALAPNGTADRSSEAFDGPARLANNGLIPEPNGYGFHSALEANPWWQVDLGAVKTICEVRMYNRLDSYWERARTIRVLLSTNGVNFEVAYAHNGSTWGQDGITPLAVINEVRNRQARYVRVQLNETQYLHLREVEVYGGPAGTGGGGGTTTAPTISVTPTSIDFGSVTTGSSSTRTVSITNTGTAALSVSSLAATAPFSVTPSSISTLAAGASTTATLTFTPTSAGAVSRSLTIASNDTARPSVTVALSGTGTAASSQPVTLSIDDGTYELTLGFPAGNVTSHFVNRLTPSRYPATLRAVQVFFPAGELPAGTAVNILAAPHAAGTGGPSLTGLTFQTLAARITGVESMIEFAITPITIQSGDFVAGFSAQNPPNVYPAVVDTSAPIAQRSYVSSDGVTFRLIEGSSAGNLGIRARVD